MFVFTIRKAKPEDAAGIARVQVIAWQKRLSAWAPEWFVNRFDVDAQREKYAQRLVNPELTLFVAQDEQEQIVGVIGAKPNADPPLSHEQKIFGLYVHPEVERQGIGSTLLGRLLDGLAQKGNQKAIVFTFAQNTPARRCYERCGGVLLPYTDSPDLDLKIPHVSYGFERLKRKA